MYHRPEGHAGDGRPVRPGSDRVARHGGHSLTAAACARRLGSSQANCSFHLRQLAKYGFVEQAAPSGDSRERPWRLTTSSSRGRPLTVVRRQPSSSGSSWVARGLVSRPGQLAGTGEPEAWRRSSFVGGATLAGDGRGTGGAEEPDARAPRPVRRAPRQARDLAGRTSIRAHPARRNPGGPPVQRGV